MKKNIKIAIINKSDSTGGAAVVSFRLMEALRGAGADARMVVAEKLTDSPYVISVGSGISKKISFLAERFKIFVENGFNRSTLFKIDTASDGFDLLKIPFVRDADVVMLNWINQGLLSLEGVRRLSEAGKRIIWTMHDMWCFTGICHHSGECRRYEGVCDDCPLLKGALDKGLARRVQRRKSEVYGEGRIDFVAVSNWLADRGERSSLFGGVRPTVIPNAFPFSGNPFQERNPERAGECVVLFGAARLDDTVKGLPILIRATEILSRDYPDVASDLRLMTFGEAKDPSSLTGIAIAHTHLGRIKGAEVLKEVYRKGDIVVSTSLYETLPGTLVEGQVYGAVPVAFARGGQGDIIEHLTTGYLAWWDDDPDIAAARIADGIVWAYRATRDSSRRGVLLRRMYESAYARFNEHTVATRYLELIDKG
ncbi:MAG: glycosyltransferase [Muribaculaceae bacterium]|nr:glycosyltransferase [Muribaculaceae bacterium]